MNGPTVAEKHGHEMCWLKVAFLMGSVLVINAETPCTTPIGDSALCIPILECRIVVDAIRYGNNTVRDAVKRFKCGKTPNGKPKVCCGPRILPENQGVPSVGNMYQDVPNPLLSPKSECGKQMQDRIHGGEKTGSASDVKLKVQVPIADHDQCQRKFSKTRAKIGENQVCAGGEIGLDSCKGDSGGPLMHTFISSVPHSLPQWYQEGIVSRGNGCGTAGFPATYTKVSRYLPWIAATMKP